MSPFQATVAPAGTDEKAQEFLLWFSSQGKHKYEWVRALVEAGVKKDFSRMGPFACLWFDELGKAQEEPIEHCARITLEEWTVHTGRNPFTDRHLKRKEMKSLLAEIREEGIADLSAPSGYYRGMANRGLGQDPFLAS